MADNEHDDGGDDGNEDVEAEAQVDFKPLIEVRIHIWLLLLVLPHLPGQKISRAYSNLIVFVVQLPPEVEIRSGEEDEEVVFKMWVLIYISEPDVKAITQMTE